MFLSHMGQHVCMDDMQMPWVMDVDLGPIVAARPDEHSDVGDGAYVFRYGCELPQPTTTPERAAHLFAQRDRAHEEALRNILEYDPPPPPPRAESESEEDISEGVNEEREEKRRVSPSRRKAPRAKSRVCVDAGAADAALLLATCTIEWRARPGGDRSDMTVVAPDGSRFRSKVAALRYLSDCCDG